MGVHWKESRSSQGRAKTQDISLKGEGKAAQLLGFTVFPICT